MPTDDYIKREDALRVLCDKCVYESRCSRENEFCNQVQGIKAIPAADVEPKQRWIPVTERLPELNQEVLVYAVGKIDGFIGESTMALTDRILFRLFPPSPGTETWSSPWQYFLTDYEITHWMPLPEPPKEEDDAT